MNILKQDKGPLASRKLPSQTSLSRISDLWEKSGISQSWYRKDKENGNPIVVIMEISFPWIGVLGFWVEARKSRMDFKLHPLGFTFDLPSAEVLGEFQVQEYFKK